MIVKCSGENCEATLTVDMPLHKDFKYTCRVHTDAAPEPTQRTFPPNPSTDLMEPIFGADFDTGEYGVRFDARKAKIPKTS